MTRFEGSNRPQASINIREAEAVSLTKVRPTIRNLPHAPEFGTIAQRVPPEALGIAGKNDGAILETAASIASGVHRPSKAPAEAERGAAQGRRLTQEAAALREWARYEGLILPEAEFDREWNASERHGGQEHDVFLALDGRTVWKRNNLSFHASWQQYFERLILHNWLFPEAPLNFEGFDDCNGELRPVTTQPYIIAERGATLDDMRPALEAKGFVHVPGTVADFYHAERGILVEDMHDENAVISEKGELTVFDPTIYASVPRNQVAKLQRLGLMPKASSPKGPGP